MQQHASTTLPTLPAAFDLGALEIPHCRLPPRRAPRAPFSLTAPPLPSLHPSHLGGRGWSTAVQPYPLSLTTWRSHSTCHHLLGAFIQLFPHPEHRPSSHPSSLHVHVLCVLLQIPLCESSIANFLQGRNKLPLSSQLVSLASLEGRIFWFLYCYPLKYVCVSLLALSSLTTRMSFIFVPHIVKNI